MFRMLALPVAFLAICMMNSSVAFADAGAVRAAERHGNRQITVFTDPTPLRAGAVDVSVLVQDAATGSSIQGDDIEIEVAARSERAERLHQRATSAAASNKLFQAATFDLPHAGWWQFEVEIGNRGEIARLSFDAEVDEALPAWQALWPWFCWPFLVIGIFIALKVQPRKTPHRSVDRG